MSNKIVNPYQKKPSVGSKLQELDAKSDIILQGMTITTNRMLVIMRIIQDNLELSNEDFDKLYEEAEQKLIEEAKARLEKTDESLPESKL